MATYLIATDSDELFRLLDAAIGGTATIARVTSGYAVRAAVKELEPDLVVLDLQIGNMGGMATCMDLRLEEGAGRLAPQNVLMLLDRPADVFLARRSGADGWVIKPIDPLRVRKAARAVQAGGTYHDEPSIA
ncbi:response regulator [Dermatobacter hominis]|uniref:response regulator n=1 Tax=Dermatobacter hominis TaxID=2884263 RepID=UPI001D0F4CF8|nr:response regulator [Dermatobacter hominis]UDY34390.1 response regulator [Dermatobacter hominis]